MGRRLKPFFWYFAVYLMLAEQKLKANKLAKLVMCTCQCFILSCHGHLSGCHAVSYYVRVSTDMTDRCQRSSQKPHVTFRSDMCQLWSQLREALGVRCEGVMFEGVSCLRVWQIWCQIRHMSHLTHGHKSSSLWTGQQMKIARLGFARWNYKTPNWWVHHLLQ